MSEKKDKTVELKKVRDEHFRVMKLGKDLTEKMLELNLIIAPLLSGNHRTDLEKLDKNIKELSVLLAEILRVPFFPMSKK